jgi:hypothetical protein
MKVNNLDILIMQVEDVDYNAAKYLKEQRSSLRNSCTKVEELFIWDTTPQRHSFWADISRKLGERK